jgi:hypothetical protein
VNVLPGQNANFPAKSRCHSKHAQRHTTSSQSSGDYFTSLAQGTQHTERYFRGSPLSFQAKAGTVCHDHFQLLTSSFLVYVAITRPPLWSCGQSSWLQIQRFRVRFPALPDFLRSNLMSITEELLEWKSSGSGSRKPRLTAVGIRCTDHATPSIRKSWH